MYVCYTECIKGTCIYTMNMNYFVKTIILYAHFSLFYDRVIVILHDRPCRTYICTSSYIGIDAPVYLKWK